MTERTARDREHGGVLPLVLGFLVILAVLFFGATTVGRFVIARQEAQRAADATCVALANIIKNEGLQVLSEQRQRAEVVGRRNSSLPMTFDWSVLPQEVATQIDLTCKATVQVPAPSFIWAPAALQAAGSAMSRVRQQTLTNVAKKYPQLTVVLDYSGSMTAGMGGATPSSVNDDSFHVLRDAAVKLLEKDYDVRYGLVIFGSGVLYATPDVKLGNGLPLMRDQVLANWGCPYQVSPNGIGCWTATAQALQAAKNLLSNPNLPRDEKKYVLLVSDGAPTVPRNNPQGQAVQQANLLWDLGATIYTLHVINVAGNAAVNQVRQFMISVSGTPSERGVEVSNATSCGGARYYYNVSDNQQVEEFFMGIGSALACSVPVSTPPTNPAAMHVFTKTPARETQLKNSRTGRPCASPGDLWDPRQPFRNDPDGWFYYDEVDKVIYVTPTACERIQGGEPVVIRTQPGLLTQ